MQLLTRKRLARVFSNLLKVLLLMTITTSASAAESSSFVLYFSRHAEKVDAKDDPVLTQAGHRRAAILATLLENAGIQKIFTTDYQRTRQTASPAGKLLKVDIETYIAGEPQKLIDQLLADKQNALIIGHSNTVPDLVHKAGGEAPDLTEEDFGDLFQLVIQDGTVVTTRLVVPMLPKSPGN